MKKNQGITLIALVITIIVLLILAAISIAALTGENGILSKSEEAKEKSTLSEESEIIKLAYTTMLTDKTVEGKEMTTSNLQEEISKSKMVVVEEVEEIPEGANRIENGLTKGIMCKITMENVYYMYLDGGENTNDAMSKFYIELYDGENLVETLTFNFEEGMKLKEWFESKYCIGITDYDLGQAYPGGWIQASFTFYRNEICYGFVLTTWNDNGATGEDNLVDGITYKAYKS